MVALLLHHPRKLAGQRDGHPDHVLRDRAGANPSGGRQHDRARNHLVGQDVTDAGSRRLHPLQSCERMNNVAVHECRKRRVPFRKGMPERFAIPHVDEGVLRKFTPQLIDKRSGQNPGLIGVDDANDDVHRGNLKM